VEIKTIGDLIPYKQSLRELWAKEEFQPVLSLLKNSYQEQCNAVTGIDLSHASEDVKTEVAVLKTRMIVFILLFDLPGNIQNVEDQLAKNQDKVVKFKASQEGGEL
jgi:hypothetical protein